ncbi:hypothetical protein CHU98_g1747 [Xylaria longipes]|nr:hypothetical protein CHU98_g1747 [Xylaria longipes]
MAEVIGFSTESWLPAPRVPLTITKAVNLGTIKNRQESDWFMGLATAMNQVKKDQPQCRMFAKMAFFMMDVLPRGLVLDFGHINGDDVMHQLLCHMNEMAASRHKVSRDADTAWQQLEKWMSLGDDWKAASQNARRDPSAGKNRYRLTGKVPGLLSPAGILAVLILAYPDIKKYQTRIEQLGIQWMIQPRDTLLVRRGFWKHITDRDLHSIFDPEEDRRSEVAFLADYTQLFGKNFTSCRVDMRPYLPPWALKYVRVTMPIEVPVDDRDDYTPYLSHEPHDVSPGDWTAGRSKLSSVLDVDASTCGNGDAHGDTDTDGDADADGDMTVELFTDEEASMNHAQEASETTDNIRGLSMALNPVHSKAETELMRWLITLPCTEEVLLPWCKFWAAMHDQARSLKRSKGYVAWELVREQLMQHVDARYARDLAMLLDRQACFFHEVQAHNIFSSYAEDVVTIDRLRARGFLLVDGLEDEEKKTYRRRLLDNRAALRLTKWQLRAIVMPGHSDVLTPEQARIYQERVARSPEGSLEGSLNHDVQHRPTIPLAIPVDTDLIDGKLGYDLFRKLFGQIPPPSFVQASAQAKVGQPQAMQLSSTHMQRPHDMVSGSEKETHLFATYANYQPKSNAARADTAPGGSSRQSSATLSAATDGSLFAVYENINQGKRTASPNARPPKRVKLADLTREEFVEDLETYSGRLKADLVGEIKSSRAELASEVTEGVAQSEASRSAKITTDIEASLDRLRSEVMKELGSQSEVQAKQISDSMTTVSKRMENNLGKLQARLANLEASLAKPSPQMGEDGFLTQNCPAPKGWNQKDYEALLTRAAINLIANQESPSGELLITIDKYTSVKDSFPDIPVHDFSVAFEHEYVRAFNRPLDRNKLLGLGD